jgi:hypothetical protein
MQFSTDSYGSNFYDMMGFDQLDACAEEDEKAFRSLSTAPETPTPPSAQPAVSQSTPRAPAPRAQSDASRTDPRRFASDPLVEASDPYMEVLEEAANERARPFRPYGSLQRTGQCSARRKLQWNE